MKISGAIIENSGMFVVEVDGVAYRFDAEATVLSMGPGEPPRSFFAHPVEVDFRPTRNGDTRVQTYEQYCRRIPGREEAA